MDREALVDGAYTMLRVAKQLLKRKEEETENLLTDVDRQDRRLWGRAGDVKEWVYVGFKRSFVV